MTEDRAMAEPVFRIGVTRDFLKSDGSIGFGDIGLGILDLAAGIAWEFLAENATELSPNVANEYDGLLVLGPRITGRTVDGAQRLVCVARFGVGYDNVDVEACTRHGVLVTITPDGVRRPVATAAITLMLALSHKLLIKDRLTRAGRWSEKLDHMGMGLTGRTLGVIGLGNIGRDIFTLARPFQMQQIAFDPFVSSADAAEVGVELVPLDEMLRSADFVCIACSLTSDTRHLINADRLALMKPTAYLINVARGPIVDQQALTAALIGQRIAGAGLDVFEKEP